jgi:hypothetical protein
MGLRHALTHAWKGILLMGLRIQRSALIVTQPAPSVLRLEAAMTTRLASPAPLLIPFTMHLNKPVGRVAPMGPMPAARQAVVIANFLARPASVTLYAHHAMSSTILLSTYSKMTNVSPHVQWARQQWLTSVLPATVPVALVM